MSEKPDLVQAAAGMQLACCGFAMSTFFFLVFVFIVAWMMGPK